VLITVAMSCGPDVVCGLIARRVWVFVPDRMALTIGAEKRIGRSFTVSLRVNLVDRMSRAAGR
jgi:hypothetical protein